MENMYKSILSIFLLCTFSYFISAQVPLKPLFEEFTSSTCGPCAPANAVLDPLLLANLQTHTALKYQVDFPLDGDPYFIEENDLRVDYYEIIGAPSLLINGNIFPDIQSINETTYNSFLNEMTFMEIDISEAKIDELNIVTVEAKITALQNYNSGLRLYALLTEASTYNNVKTNGEIVFHDVVLGNLTQSPGEILPSITNGEQIELSYTFNAGETFMETANDLRVVIFIQDDIDKSVIQSESANIDFDFQEYDLVIDIKDQDGNSIENAEIVLQSNGTKMSDENGLVSYENLLNGTYNYFVRSPGFLDNTGIVEIIDDNVTLSIILELPDFFFYEDFTSEPTSDWSPFGTLPASVFWTDDRFLFFNSSDPSEFTYLVSPLFDLSNNTTGQVVYNLERQQGAPTGGFGTIADKEDFLTSVEYEELSLAMDSEAQNYITEISDIQEDLTEVQFYWSIDNVGFAAYALNYFYITEGAISSTDEELLQDIRIYPNPTLEYITIDSNLPFNEIRVFDASGKLMISKQTSIHENSLDISLLDSGYYLIALNSELGTSFFPVIKE